MKTKSTVWMLLIAGCMAVSCGHAADSTFTDQSALPSIGAVNECVVVVGKGRPASDIRAVEAYISEAQKRSSISIQVVDEIEFATLPHEGKTVMVVGTVENNKLISEWLGADLPADGFALESQIGATNWIYVAGQSQSGLLAGIGRLLRLMHFSDGSVHFPVISERDFPRMPIRGMYLATHFHNFYENAPTEELAGLVADMALWGANNLSFIYPSEQNFKIDDPKSIKTLNLLKCINASALNFGMHTGLIHAPNLCWKNTQDKLKAIQIPGVYTTDGAVCASNPDGMALISQTAKEIFHQFDHLDFLIPWPYDPGGCGCAQCMPWGGNGFVKASKASADEFHATFPDGKVILSTWWFARPVIPALHDDFHSLFQTMEQENPIWIDGFLTGENNHIMQVQLLDRPNPNRYPLTCFPEISMHKMKPWGGYGANPLPEFNQKYAQAVEGLIEGGWPYSEGIYDDINKFYWIRHFWNPEQSTDEILADYASYYLSPEVAPDAVHLFHLLEKTMPQSGWGFGDSTDVQEAWRLVRNIDSRLPTWSKKSWRWRLLFIRAGIGGVVVEQGLANPEAMGMLKGFRNEIREIYHVTDSTAPCLRGFDLPEGDVENIAFGCRTSVSSTHPSVPTDAAQNLTDGKIDNLWLHYAGKERKPQVTIDLKRKIEVTVIQLYCVAHKEHYMFVPSSVTVEVSLDGETFKPAPIFLNEAPEPISFYQSFPSEGSEFTKEPAEFGINEQARYIRFTFGASHHDTRAVGLAEIMIRGHEYAEKSSH